MLRIGIILAVLLLAANVAAAILLAGASRTRTIEGFRLDKPMAAAEKESYPEVSLLLEKGLGPEMLLACELPDILDGMENLPELRLSEAQRSRVLPRRDALRRCREELAGIRRDVENQRESLQECGWIIFKNLDKSQLALIGGSRDEISLSGFEKPYWDALLRKLREAR